MKSIILTKPAIIAGTHHSAGAELTLSDGTADWLIQHAQAKPAPAKPQSKRKDKEQT